MPVDRVWAEPVIGHWYLDSLHITRKRGRKDEYSRQTHQLLCIDWLIVHGNGRRVTESSRAQAKMPCCSRTICRSQDLRAHNTVHALCAGDACLMSPHHPELCWRSWYWLSTKMGIIRRIVGNDAIKLDPPEVYNWRVFALASAGCPNSYSTERILTSSIGILRWHPLRNGHRYHWRCPQASGFPGWVRSDQQIQRCSGKPLSHPKSSLATECKI